MGLASIKEFIFPQEVYIAILEHGKRKINQEYLPGEYQEPKAYGLIGGSINGEQVEVVGTYVLTKNQRGSQDQKAQMDKNMKEYAVPSETPMEKRGWIADPEEVWEAISQFSEQSGSLVGNYHTHRIAWEHDPERDTCTKIDRELAKNSGQWVFILSVVNPGRPILRAFYEGQNKKEALITIKK